MIALFSFRSMLKHAKLWVKLIVLVLIIFYILPKLLNLFWDSNHSEPKIREEQLLEKPLRVMVNVKLV